jgi:hypothetical protein
MTPKLALVSSLAALVVATAASGATPTGSKERLTAHLTVRQQPGHPKQVGVATRFDVGFTLQGSALAWDGIFNQLSSFPFTIRIVFPDKSAPAVPLCTNPWPATIQCSTPQGEPLSAGVTPVTGEALGNATLNPAQRKAVLGGKGYAVLTTAVNPGGEIRGQITPRK